MCIQANRNEAFKRHAELGFLAASAFPIPRDHVQGVTLPAGLSVDGMRMPDMLEIAMPMLKKTKKRRMGRVPRRHCHRRDGPMRLSGHCLGHQRRRICWRASY